MLTNFQLISRTSKSLPPLPVFDDEDVLSTTKTSLCGGFVWTIFNDSLSLRVDNPETQITLSEWDFSSLPLPGGFENLDFSNSSCIVSVAAVPDRPHLLVILLSASEPLPARLVVLDLSLSRIVKLVVFLDVSPFETCTPFALDEAQNCIFIALAAPLIINWVKVSLSPPPQPLYPSLDGYDANPPPFQELTYTPCAFASDRSCFPADSLQHIPLISSAIPTFSVWHRDHAHSFLLVTHDVLTVLPVDRSSGYLSTHGKWDIPLHQALSVVPVLSSYSPIYQYLWVISRSGESHQTTYRLTLLAMKSMTPSALASLVVVEFPLASPFAASPFLSAQSVNNNLLLISFLDGSGYLLFPVDSFLHQKDFQAFPIPAFESYSPRLRIGQISPLKAIFFAPSHSAIHPVQVHREPSTQLREQGMLTTSVVTSDRVVFQLQYLSPDPYGAVSVMSQEHLVRKHLASLTLNSAELRRDYFDQLFASGRISSLCGCLFLAPQLPESFLWEREILSWAWHDAFEQKIRAKLNAHYQKLFSSTFDTHDDNTRVQILTALRDLFGELGLLHSLFQCLSSKNVTEEGAHDLYQKVKALLIESQLLELISWFLIKNLLPRFSFTRIFAALPTSAFLQHLLVECEIALVDVRDLSLSHLFLQHFKSCDPMKVEAKRSLLYYVLLELQTQILPDDDLTFSPDSPLLTQDGGDDLCAEFAANFLLPDPATRLIQGLWHLDHQNANLAFGCLTRSPLPLPPNLLFQIMRAQLLHALPQQALHLWRTQMSVTISALADARVLFDAHLDAKLLLEPFKLLRTLRATLSASDLRKLAEHFYRRTLTEFSLFKVIALPYSPPEEALFLEIVQQSPLSTKSFSSADIVATYHLTHFKPYAALSTTVSPTASPTSSLIYQLTSSLQSTLPPSSPSYALPPSCSFKAPSGQPLPPSTPHNKQLSRVTFSDAPMMPISPALEAISSTPMKSFSPRPSFSSPRVPPNNLIQPASPQPTQSSEEDLKQISQQNFSPLRLRSGKSLPRTPGSSMKTPRKPSKLANPHFSETAATSSPNQGLRTLGRVRPRVRTNL